jgi:hypothetical protein
VLERDLVVILERADLAQLHPAQAEIRVDRRLRFGVDAPVVAVWLGDAELAAIERGDELLDPVGRKLVYSTSSRIRAARTQSSSAGTSESLA